MIRKKTPSTNMKAVGRPVSRHEPGTRMSVLLANPDYLLEGFAEKKCQYLGELKDIPTSVDMSKRGYLLSQLDTQRNHGRLPWKLGPEHNVTLTLSAYNVKVVKNDGSEEVLHRIPIHEIASASYVNDDDQHLLFVKAGDATQPCCPCIVLNCGKRVDAEEICSILQQAFQLVYTEATVQHLNESISAGERGSVVAAPTATTPRQRQDKPAQETDALTPPEDTEEGLSAEELVQCYMERLHKLLDFRELKEFATLLKRYRDDLPVREFLSKLKDLYGQQRSFLIPDMHSFVPEEDRAEFEEFLAQHNLRPTGQAVRETGTRPPATADLQVPEGRRGHDRKPTKQRSSRKQHGSHVADVDRFLQDIDAQMNTMVDTN